VGTPGAERTHHHGSDVTMDDARIEDMLRLAVKTPAPPMTGSLKLTTTLVLPPGQAGRRR